MKKDMLGVIDATTFHKDLDGLTVHRSVAAMPFGGRYRLIDFILSNMVNSDIQSVAIFSKYHYRSLMDHLGSGRNWDLNRKRDGLFFFPSTLHDKPVTGIGPLEDFAANIDFFTRSRQPYAIVANAYTVFNMDFCPILDEHIESGKDITEIMKNGSSLGIYLLKRELLIELIEKREVTGYQTIRDALTDLNSQYSVHYHQYENFAIQVDSIRSYFEASKSLLNPAIWNELFAKERPILTKVKDEPPARYTSTSSVTNSIIANGCHIEGVVENSIIARGVTIGKGAVVKNCIIMQKSKVGENSVLDHVILDKDVLIEDGVELIASEKSPNVIRKGRVQGVWNHS
ncbi:glucose-1-phosphate adenylyltransferase [Neobacillus notoginsengisoli]|uniref:Glucose-1-phosphate adenylyltransferase n=1 Tax=Neobacillus notoginsengisoli TaxID=1578198 RepID=A0A417YX95_9BACI|nr:sugar phosphate nucleotidyltransferase [Neobacillus notoginsengisoli]RHW42176.1 glucose-1-phosphate adenylyltransferase [Neobacillus notoginsengisoli]